MSKFEVARKSFSQTPNGENRKHMINVMKVREQQEKRCLLLMVLRVHLCGKRRLDIVASAGFNTKTCSQSSDSGRIVKKSFRSNADNIAVKCRPTLSNWNIVDK